MSLENGWNRMVVDNFGGHPFLGHFWYANYYQAYYRKSPLMAMTAHKDDGDMIAGLPMVLGNRRMAGIPLKEARILAGAHSHLNKILVTAEHEEAVRLFMQQLINEGVDLIYFEDIPDEFPNHDWITEFCSRERMPVEARLVRQSPYIPTTGTFDEYRKLLSKKFRELLNNRLNRINRAGGFEIKTFTQPEDYADLIDDMRAVAGQSWQGENNSGLFSGKDNDQFYGNLIRHALEKGYGRVFILYFEGRPVAFEFHVYFESTEYCLKSEYSREFDKLSPGSVLDLELVKRAFNSEIEIYDLLGFEDEYKLRWTKNRTPYRRYFIFNRSAAGRLAYLLYYRLGNRLRKSAILRRLRERAPGK